MLRAVVGDFEPHFVSEVALREAPTQRRAQVLYLLFVNEELAVARDAELIGIDDPHPGEQLIDVRMENGREEDEIVGAGRSAVRQTNDAW